MIPASAEMPIFLNICEPKNSIGAMRENSHRPNHGLRTDRAVLELRDYTVAES